ncbi:MAG TPA: DUF1648 domain-containing protein [Thermomicrobiales bacterium]|nr:DUF1648 domain-containing protein [Thermomicrobiales bacterium]
MKVNLRTELPQWLLMAGMFLASAIAWPTTPDRVPMHWNAAGEVDGYGGKLEGLFLLPAITLGLYLLLLFLPRIDPGRANYSLFSGSYAIIRISMVVLMAAIHALVLLWIKDIKVNASLVVMTGVGLLFIVIGLVLGKVQPNWFVGIRTPWTLSSRRSWVRTHRLGGWLFIAMGLVMIAAEFLSASLMAPVILVTTLGSVVVMFVYSYLEWRKDPDKLPPGSRLPG